MVLASELFTMSISVGPRSIMARSLSGTALPVIACIVSSIRRVCMSAVPVSMRSNEIWERFLTHSK